MNADTLLAIAIVGTLCLFAYACAPLRQWRAHRRVLRMRQQVRLADPIRMCRRTPAHRIGVSRVSPERAVGGRGPQARLSITPDMHGRAVVHVLVGAP